MKMSAQGIMWVEKYRPKTLKDIVGQKNAIGSLSSFVSKPSDMPHLLFSGSPGVGKTTAAVCLCRSILGESWKDNTLELNASDERGIGMVRERIKKFSKFVGIGDIPFKVIILDEADEMTSDAQTALRRIIEDAAQYCRFVIIANNISKIIQPIQSRCAVFKFVTIPKENVLERLAEIAKSEKTKFDKEGIDAIYEYSRGDLRHAINTMQAAAALGGGVNKSNASKAAGIAKTSSVDKILDLALDGKVAQAREDAIELLRVYGMSSADILRALNMAVNQKAPSNAIDIVRIISEYDYRLLVGATPEIQISAMLYEIGALGSGSK